MTEMQEQVLATFVEWRGWAAAKISNLIDENNQLTLRADRIETRFTEEVRRLNDELKTERDRCEALSRQLENEIKGVVKQVTQATTKIWFILLLSGLALPAVITFILKKVVP